jgi:putative membrane protein
MLGLTDRLAVTRTDLANERTLLAYIRTALALAAGGLGLVQFFSSPIAVALGWILMPVGVVVLFIGAERFRRARRKLHALTDADLSNES